MKKEVTFLFNIRFLPSPPDLDPREILLERGMKYEEVTDETEEKKRA